MRIIIIIIIIFFSKTKLLPRDHVSILFFNPRQMILLGYLNPSTSETSLDIFFKYNKGLVSSPKLVN